MIFLSLIMLFYIGNMPWQAAIAMALNFGLVAVLYNGYTSLKLIFSKGYIQKKMTEITPMRNKRGIILVIAAISIVVTPLVVLPFTLIGNNVINQYTEYWIGLSVWTKLFLYLQWTHVLSIMSFLVLLLYLWKRWSNLFCAITVSFLGIGVSEFMAIPVHLIKWGNIFPWFWAWYIPFALMIYPYMLVRKYFKPSKWFWLGLCISPFLELIVFLPQMQWVSIWDWNKHLFTLNPAYIGQPFTGGMFLFELTGRIRRTKDVLLMTLIKKV